MIEVEKGATGVVDAAPTMVLYVFWEGLSIFAIRTSELFDFRAMRTFANSGGRKKSGVLNSPSQGKRKTQYILL